MPFLSTAIAWRVFARDATDLYGVNFHSILRQLSSIERWAIWPTDSTTIRQFVVRWYEFPSFVPEPPGWSSKPFPDRRSQIAAETHVHVQAIFKDLVF
jgi:hypothetical protein